MGGHPALHISGCAPTLRFEDTTSSNDDWEIMANSDDLNFYKEGVATPLMILTYASAGAGILDLVCIGNRIDFDTDNDTSIRASADDVLTFEAGGTDTMYVTTGNVGIGTAGPNETLTVEAGILSIKEAATPTATTDYGKIYTKTDNKLYFQDGAGTEHEIAYATDSFIVTE